MKRRKESIRFWIVTVCLIIVCVFCTTGTVVSQSNISDREMERYYQVKETELVDETRNYLELAGYRNSGVMLTRVIDEGGTREYTLTIHHDKINALDETSKEILRNELSKFLFVAENCTFYHEFLTME